MAIDLPMPRLPPVTKATLPFKENSPREKFIAYLLKKILVWPEANIKVYIVEGTTRNLEALKRRVIFGRAKAPHYIPTSKWNRIH